MTYLVRAGADWYITDWSFRAYIDSPQAAADGIAQFGWKAQPDGTPFPLPVSMNPVWDSLPFYDSRPLYQERP